MAKYNPLSSSLINTLIRSKLLSIISSVPSDDLPSTTMYSKSLKSCCLIELIVSARVVDEFLVTVIIVRKGFSVESREESSTMVNCNLIENINLAFRGLLEYSCEYEHKPI